MTDQVTDLHVRVWGKGERVVLVHGSNVPDPSAIWTEQRRLADRYQLIVLDRRGYGESPATEKPDFEVDVRDVTYLLGASAHLVGFSYGGVISLLVAGRRPDLVRSLTLIEPPAFSVARGNPAVERLIEAQAPLYSDPDMTPERFMTGFLRSLGFDGDENVPLPAEARRSVTATMTEPPPWEAEVPLDRLATAPFPKLVVSGNWHETMELVANILAERLRAQRLVVEGAGHSVRQMGERLNDHLVSLIESTTSDMS